MKYNFNNYIVTPPKGFLMYMNALAFYCSFSKVNEKVEELLIGRGGKMDAEILESVANDSELQRESSGNQWAMIENGYERPEDYEDLTYGDDSEWDDDDATWVGFQTRTVKSNNSSAMSELVVAGLLTPKNWDELSKLSSKPWPANPLMEAYKAAFGDDEEGSKELYEGGLPWLLEESGIDLSEFGDLGEWIDTFSYMPA